MQLSFWDLRVFSRPLVAAVVVAFTVASIAQTPGPRGGGQQPEFVRQARGLMQAGKLEEALAVYEAELKTSPGSATALNGAGVTLDLLGRTTEARQYFQRVIDAASTDQQKVGAWRAMAMSYAFDNDCANSWKYEKYAYDLNVRQNDFYQQGERTNEAARVCIEAGDYAMAEKLYRMGTEAGLKEPSISSDRRALWHFRLEHALARLAARRGDKAAAERHVAAARKILDENPGMAKDQAPFFPYLTGYVALYTSDAGKALSELQNANQRDPFIQCLMAMAHEKLGDKQKAIALYRQAARTTGHNPPAAYARPLATEKLRELGAD